MKKNKSKSKGKDKGKVAEKPRASEGKTRLEEELETEATGRKAKKVNARKLRRAKAKAIKTAKKGKDKKGEGTKRGSKRKAAKMAKSNGALDLATSRIGRMAAKAVKLTSRAVRGMLESDGKKPVAKRVQKKARKMARRLFSVAIRAMA